MDPDPTLSKEFVSRLNEKRPDGGLLLLPKEPLYHYTTAGGFEGIVRTRAMRATNFSFMNDPSEIVYGRDLVLQLLKKCKEVNEPDIVEALNMVDSDLQHLSEIYVASFSSAKDDLSQWRAYGAGTPARYALGFEASDIQKATIRRSSHYVRFLPVVYEEKEQSDGIQLVLDVGVEFLRNKMKVNPPALLSDLATVLSAELLRMLPGLKEPAYRAEREWRVVILLNPGVHKDLGFDTSRGVIRPYALFRIQTKEGQPLQLKSLTVLAPARSEAAVKAAGMVLKDVGIVGVVPRPSGIPFAE